MLRMFRSRQFSRGMMACTAISCLLLLLCLEGCNNEETDISKVPSLFGPGSFAAFTITCADYAFDNWAGTFRYLLAERAAGENGPTQKDNDPNARGWITQKDTQLLTSLEYLVAALFFGSGPPHHQTFNIALKVVLTLVLAPAGMHDEPFIFLIEDQIQWKRRRGGACHYGKICLAGIVLLNGKLIKDKSWPRGRDGIYQPSDIYIFGLIIGAAVVLVTKACLRFLVLLHGKRDSNTFQPQSRKLTYQPSEACVLGSVVGVAVGVIPVWYWHSQMKPTFRVPIPQTAYRLSDLDQVFPLALALLCVLINRRNGIIRCLKACGKYGEWRAAEHGRWIRSPYQFNWQTVPVVESSMERWTTRRWETQIWKSGTLGESRRKLEEDMQRLKEQQIANEAARRPAYPEEESRDEQHVDI